MKKKCLNCGGFLGKYAYKKLNAMKSAYNYVYVCKKCGKMSVFNYVNDVSYAVPVNVLAIRSKSDGTIERRDWF